SGRLNIGNFITIEGSVDFTMGAKETFSGNSLKVFFGHGGPATLDDGTANPSAQGILLTGASLAVERFANANAPGGYDYAVYTTPPGVGLVGIAGVTLTGSLTVMFNNHGTDWTSPAPSSILVPAGSQSFQGSLHVSVFGQTLIGTFAFTKTAIGG